MTDNISNRDPDGDGIRVMPTDPGPRPMAQERITR